MQRYVKFCRLLSRAAGYLGAFFILLAIVTVSIGVFARRVLGSPLLFTDELSSYYLAAIIFGGLGYTMMTEGNVRVDLILGRLSGKAYIFLSKLWNLIGICYALIFFMGNLLLFKDFVVRQSISTQQLQIPLWIPGTMLLLGSLILLLQTVAQLFVPVYRKDLS